VTLNKLAIRLLHRQGSDINNLQEYQNPVKSLEVSRLVKFTKMDAHFSAACRVASPVPNSSDIAISGRESISGRSMKSSIDSLAGKGDVADISSKSKMRGGLEDRAIGLNIAR
jgi:hypothetical protein